MRAAAVCVVGALLALVLKKGTPSLALLLSIGVAAVVMLSLGEALGELTAFSGNWGSRAAFPGTCWPPSSRLPALRWW